MLKKRKVMLTNVQVGGKAGDKADASATNSATSAAYGAPAANGAKGIDSGNSAADKGAKTGTGSTRTPQLVDTDSHSEAPSFDSCDTYGVHMVGGKRISPRGGLGLML